MMDLNLLPSSAKFQAKKMLLKKQIAMFTWGFVGLWLILVVAVLLVWIVARTNLSNNEKSYQKLVNQYKSLASNISINQNIKYRAKLVGKVLSDRFEYGDTIQSVNDLFSTNVVVENVEISNKKTCLVKGKVLTGENVDEVEKKIIDINNKKLDNFVAAKLESLGINSDGSWNFDMEVALK